MIPTRLFAENALLQLTGANFCPGTFCQVPGVWIAIGGAIIAAGKPAPGASLGSSLNTKISKRSSLPASPKTLPTAYTPSGVCPPRPVIFTKSPVCSPWAGERIVIPALPFSVPSPLTIVVKSLTPKELPFKVNAEVASLDVTWIAPFAIVV